MIRFFETPWITRVWYPSLIWKIKSKDSIYLTFDDGPHPEVTPWVLKELAYMNAKATFFCLGKNLEKHPEIANQIISSGHQIGNHTYKHEKGWKVSDGHYLEDIRKCDQQIGEMEIETNLFRPPYGRIKKSQISRLGQKKIIMWSHLSWDFDPQVNVSKSIKKLKQAKAGSILVFHDSEKAFENLKVILPEILLHFQSKGLKFEVLKS